MIRRVAPNGRGGGFLLFLAVLLPLTLVGVALSADYTRVILAKRQAANTADVVAMAAATALFARGETMRIDEEEARRRAEELFARAGASGMLPKNMTARLVSVTVCKAADGDCPAGQEVTVAIEYEVPGFIVVRVAAPGAETDVGGSVRRSARVCDPRDPPTAAGCAYPVGR